MGQALVLSGMQCLCLPRIDMKVYGHEVCLMIGLPSIDRTVHRELRLRKGGTVARTCRGNVGLETGACGFGSEEPRVSAEKIIDLISEAHAERLSSAALSCS